MAVPVDVSNYVSRTNSCRCLQQCAVYVTQTSHEEGNKYYLKAIDKNNPDEVCSCEDYFTKDQWKKPTEHFCAIMEKKGMTCDGLCIPTTAEKTSTLTTTKTTPTTTKTTSTTTKTTPTTTTSDAPTTTSELRARITDEISSIANQIPDFSSTEATAENITAAVKSGMRGIVSTLYPSEGTCLGNIPCAEYTKCLFNGGMLDPKTGKCPAHPKIVGMLASF